MLVKAIGTGVIAASLIAVPGLAGAGPSGAGRCRQYIRTRRPGNDVLPMPVSLTGRGQRRRPQKQDSSHAGSASTAVHMLRTARTE